MTIQETIQILERMLDPDPWEVWELSDEAKEALEVAVDALERMTKQQWIPCSERLPEQYGNYFVSISEEEPDIGTINPYDKRGWSLCDANGFYWASDRGLNVVAWMPLPEPYIERRTDG